MGRKILPQLPDILRGCKIFPCLEGGKHPATKNGWQDASSDPEVLAAWERENPDYNWAVATGPSGLFVLDIDPEGLDWFDNLLNHNPDVKAAVDGAFQVKTPRGGFHIYFKGQGPSTASRIADGIDTRGGMIVDGKIVSGGYVLLPGSRTNAGDYTVINAAPIPELSESIKRLVPERKKTETQGLERNPDQDQPRNVKWAEQLIDSYVEEGRVSVQGKGGNDTAFRVIASILDKAISPALCFDLLAEKWNPYCQPPWDGWELETLIRNAARYGEDTEGGVKGFQANADAFAAFAGKDFGGAPARAKTKLQWLHDYADSVQDPTWLVPDILPARGTGMLYGPSGSYKSFVALDMALSLGFGISGQWGTPPVKNDVLYLAGEGPVSTAKKRWPAWLEWQKIEFRTDHRVILHPRVPFFTDTEAWEQIKIDLAAMDCRPSLIVIDTLSRLLTGLDENNAKDATMITGFLEDLASYYECFVLAVHHTGKDEKKGARGSSAFYANMDAVISTRLRPGGTELKVRKQKDADVSEAPTYLQVKEVGSSIVLEQVDEMPEEPKAGKSRFEWAERADIVAILNDNGGELSGEMLVMHIAEREGLDPSVVRRRIMGNKDLQWLRDGSLWRIPHQEYDL